jgi:hypothetical protein
MANLVSLTYKVLPMLILAPAVALAWDTPPQQSPAPWAKSHAAATSNATANAKARARASQSQTVNVVTQPSPGASTASQAPGNVNAPVTTWSGWNGNPVASAVAPPVTTYNPCAGAAASFGAQTPMFGLSAGGPCSASVPAATRWIGAARS